MGLETTKQEQVKESQGLTEEEKGEFSVIMGVGCIGSYEMVKIQEYYHKSTKEDIMKCWELSRQVIIDHEMGYVVEQMKDVFVDKNSIIKPIFRVSYKDGKEEKIPLEN